MRGSRQGSRTPECVAMGAPAEQDAELNMRLALRIAMAMFVLVVDTSLMNVSISAVVHDLDTTVSGVQSAIALEALVSAAFILIGSKVGDLIGRKKAYVLGLLGYAIGALAMATGIGRGVTPAQRILAPGPTTRSFRSTMGATGARLVATAHRGSRAPPRR